jgi:hypothetical protein
MARTANTQLNIRSQFARDRAALLARETGMTTTQVVEEALRAYRPPPDRAVPRGLVRRGPLLVMPAGDRQISLEQANDALAETRGERE